MRIGIFVWRDLNLAGGSLIRIVGITKYLHEMGCKVTVFAPNETPLLKPNVEFVRLGKDRSRSWSLPCTAFPSLRRMMKSSPADRSLVGLFRAHNLDVIHCHQHVSAYRLFKIQPSISIPIIFEMHGILKLQLDDMKRRENDFPFHVSIQLKAEKTLFSNMKWIFARTEIEKNFLQNEFGVSPDRVYVVPNGVDIDDKNMIPSDELEAWKRKLGLAKAGKIVLFGGEFKAHSGVLDLVKAFAILRQEMRCIQLVLVGDGFMMDFVRKYIISSQLKDVVLTGRVERGLFNVYQQLADVVITPNISSSYNNLAPPLKLYECLACGKPTVATKIRSHEAIIQDGLNGYFAKPEDPFDLAAAIRRALTDERASEVGRRGRQTMVEEYSWRKVAKHAVTAYDEIIRRSKGMTV